LPTKVHTIAKRESRRRSSGSTFFLLRNKPEASRPTSGIEDEGDGEGECVDGVPQRVTNERVLATEAVVDFVFVHVDRELKVDKAMLNTPKKAAVSTCPQV
jgi:hypothetical protein